MINSGDIRKHFPQLSDKVHGNKSLCYLDSAASTLKPISVINRISKYYSHESCNVHRGVHFLAEQATQDFERSRNLVREFINAKNLEEIIFTSGTTESINIVAQSLAKSFFKNGDEIILSQLEHHSNIVPWQLIQEFVDVKLRIVNLTDDFSISLKNLKELINPKTKMISIAYVSNALGVINPVHEIISLAKNNNILSLVDAAQAIATVPIDVQKLDCDFLAFSGHKIFGPTGIGVLYGRKNLLEQFHPWKGGGDMIKSVTFEKTTFNDLPFRLEAGTSHIEGVIGLAESIQFVKNLGFKWIESHEKDLVIYGHEQLSKIDKLKIYGNSKLSVPIFSFTIEGVHPGDLGTLLDQEGIAVRAGHHCAEPLMKYLGVSGTCRASCSLYSTKEDIDSLINSLKKVMRILI